MTISKKTEERVIQLRLSLLDETYVLQDGFIKCKTNDFLPPINFSSLIESIQESDDKQAHINHRHPKNNPSTLRIFNDISQGKWNEVDFSLQFVSFQDSHYNNQTAAIAGLFSKHPIKRKLMIKCLMKWKFDFKIPDLIYCRDPLHWCCILGYKNEYHLIIDYLNCDVDYHTKDIDGNTYLHLAVTSNCLYLVKAISNSMMVNEISADVSNNLGLTPYILSRKLGHRKISIYLQSIPISSVHVFDNKWFKTPREWSALGHISRSSSKAKPKAKNYTNVKTFKIPQSLIQNMKENFTEKKDFDMNKIIHSVYMIWTNQNADSFRKTVRNKNPMVAKSNLAISLPPFRRMSKSKWKVNNLDI